MVGMARTSGLPKRFTAAEREELLKAYRRSDSSQREFCARHGLGLSTLGFWLRKEKRHRSSEAGFVEIPNLATAASAPALYRVHLRNGVSLELSPGFRSVEVEALIGLLQA